MREWFHVAHGFPLRVAETMSLDSTAVEQLMPYRVYHKEEYAVFKFDGVLWTRTIEDGPQTSTELKHDKEKKQTVMSFSLWPSKPEPVWRTRFKPGNRQDGEHQLRPVFARILEEYDRAEQFALFEAWEANAERKEIQHLIDDKMMRIHEATCQIDTTRYERERGGLWPGLDDPDDPFVAISTPVETDIRQEVKEWVNAELRLQDPHVTVLGAEEVERRVMCHITDPLEENADAMGLFALWEVEGAISGHLIDAWKNLS